MKNCDSWKPSKYAERKGRLRASKDPNDLGIGSRLTADLVAECYDAALRVHARGRLLDLGCGRAPLFGYYRRFVTENICVDWAQSLHETNYLDYEVDLTKCLPFSNGEFDTIVLSDVLEHIPNPVSLCQEMARVLSPKGKLILNVPFYYWLHEEPHDYYRFTEFALRRFMEQCNLQLLELKTIGGAAEVLTDIVAKNVVQLPIAGSKISLVVQSLALIFARSSLGRKVSEATGHKFPLGYFLVAAKI